MNIQLIVVAVVVAVCVAYAIVRIRKALQVEPGDPCNGCALKEACRRNKGRGCNDRKPLPQAES